MTLTWTKENSPRWDADKQRVFGPAELAAVGLAEPAPGEPVADEWWRVTDGDQVAGYGWLDTEWGDARITFVVAPGGRGRGVGAFILERLEDEAAARGLNYIYNVVPDTHPDGPWIRNWLATHGFHEASRGQLRRQVVMSAGSRLRSQPKGGRGRHDGQEERGDRVAAHHDLLPVHPVGHGAGEQPETEIGQEFNQA
jgi:GNAT superfamily N-acetyltransferase